MDDFFSVLCVTALVVAMLLGILFTDSDVLSNKRRLEQIRVHQTLSHYECNKLDVNTILCKKRK
jgi:hypothetical protein